MKGFPIRTTFLLSLPVEENFDPFSDYNHCKCISRQQQFCQLRLISHSLSPSLKSIVKKSGLFITIKTVFERTKTQRDIQNQKTKLKTGHERERERKVGRKIEAMKEKIYGEEIFSTRYSSYEKNDHNWYYSDHFFIYL